MSRDAIKKAVGEKAAEFVKEGMRVGLGTGSTTAYFIKALSERCRAGLKIQAIASSQESLLLAEQGGIPLCDSSAVTELDLVVDGADEIDPQKRLIKGGGGALVREKIVACMSREMIVIVDESKLTPMLGKAKLPVEIIPFAKEATLNHIRKVGHPAELRRDKKGELFISDNGNLLVDIHLSKPCENPEEIHERLLHIPGVVDTGFFFNLAGRVIIGFADGQVIVRE